MITYSTPPIQPHLLETILVYTYHTNTVVYNNRPIERLPCFILRQILLIPIPIPYPPLVQQSLVTMVSTMDRDETKVLYGSMKTVLSKQGSGTLSYSSF